MEQLKAQLIAQQNNLENMFTDIVEQMHEALVRNRAILEGKLEEIEDELPVVQVNEEPEEVLFVGQEINLDGFDLTISSIGGDYVLCQAIVLDGKGGSRFQNIQIPKDRVLTAIVTADDLKSEVA